MTSRATPLMTSLAASLLLLCLWAANTPGSAGADSSPSATPTPSSTAASGAATTDGDTVVLNVGWATDPQNLNPFIGMESSTQELITLQYDYLTDYDPHTLQPRPRLAESWSMSPDGLRWDFKIREGVTFHDGTPCTAEDVAFTFNYIKENELGLLVSFVVNIDRVEAVDAGTARFFLEKPKANMLALMVPILPRHIWQDIDPEAAASSFQNDPPVVGSGPFQIVEYQPNGYTRLIANKDYWGGAPHVDELIFRVYQSRLTMASDLQKGTIDAACELQRAVYEKLTDTPGMATSRANPYRASTDLGFNCYDSPDSKGHPVLLDPAFRRALNYAIDKQQICEIVYGGDAVPADTILPSDYYTDPDWHWTPPADTAYTYDLDTAGRLLDEAGYRDADGDGLREYKGEPIALRLYTYEADPGLAPTGKIIVGALEEVGLEIEFQVMDEGAMIDKMWAYDGDTFTPDYDLFIWGWGGDIDPDFLLSVFTTAQIENWSDCNWSSEEYDRLYLEQSQAMDPEQRKQIVWEAQELVYDESPTAFITYPAFYGAWNTADWQGWVRTPAQTGQVVNTQYFADTYVNVRPRAATAAAAEGGIGAGTIVAIAIGAAAVIAIAGWMLVRRKRARRVEEQ